MSSLSSVLERPKNKNISNQDPNLTPEQEAVLIKGIFNLDYTKNRANNSDIGIDYSKVQQAKQISDEELAKMGLNREADGSENKIVIAVEEDALRKVGLNPEEILETDLKNMPDMTSMQNMTDNKVIMDAKDTKIVTSKENVLSQSQDGRDIAFETNDIYKPEHSVENQIGSTNLERLDEDQLDPEKRNNIAKEKADNRWKEEIKQRNINPVSVEAEKLREEIYKKHNVKTKDEVNREKLDFEREEILRKEALADAKEEIKTNRLSSASPMSKEIIIKHLKAKGIDTEYHINKAMEELRNDIP